MFVFGGLFIFPRSRIDFQKKLDEKHKKQTSCPKNIMINNSLCFSSGFNEQTSARVRNKKKQSPQK